MLAPLSLWIQHTVALRFTCLTKMDRGPKCFFKSSNGLWRTCAVLGDNSLSVSVTHSLTCVCLCFCLFVSVFICVCMDVFLFPVLSHTLRLGDGLRWGGAAVWKWDKDVWFIGSDRKSILRNVYNPPITTQPNERTIIQSFTPYLPEAGSTA